MNNLATGMNTRVGAAGTLHSKRGIGDSAESMLDGGLNGLDVKVRLCLPAVKGLTVVLDPAGHPATRRQRVGRKRKRVSQSGLATHRLQL